MERIENNDRKREEAELPAPICSAKYDYHQIASELRATALGISYYGNALKVSLDFSCVQSSPDHKGAIQRYLSGMMRASDHVRLQEVAMMISSANSAIPLP